MMTNSLTLNQLDQCLEQNMQLALDHSSMLIMHGEREFDVFLTTKNEKPLPCKLENKIHKAIDSVATFIYEPATNELQLVYLKDAQTIPPESALPTSLGQIKVFAKSSINDRANLLEHALTSFQAFKTKDDQKTVLIVNASLLFQDAGRPHEEEFQLVQKIEAFVRQRSKTHKIVLRVKDSNKVPRDLKGFGTHSTPILATTQDERYAFIKLTGMRLSDKLDASIDDVAKTLACATEGFMLCKIGDLISQAIKNDSVTNISDLTSAANAFSMGLSQSAWNGQRIKEILKNIKQTLQLRVIGQEAALEACANAINAATIKSANNTDAASKPRAVLFLAGPTGVGKTETVRTLGEAIYGSQRHLVRIDCGELTEAHSVSKLMGSPPGYVGYGETGQIVQAMKNTPNCILLFDEAEKMHSNVWLPLLAMLDDGRVTSSQGETYSLSESIICFTTNLGMYNRLDGRLIEYHTDYPTLAAKMIDNIDHEFKEIVRRPELLGRLGGKENIIVFDFIRDIRGVLNKKIQNEFPLLYGNQNVEVFVDDSVIDYLVELCQKDESTLTFGARGIHAILKRRLFDVVKNFVIDSDKNIYQVKVLMDTSINAIRLV